MDGVRAGRSEFSSQKKKNFSLLHNFQNGTATLSASYPIGTRGFFLSVKATDVKLVNHLHLVPRLGMMELYLHFPIHLHGVVLNYS
jgi:hypothetical protein